MCYVGLKVLNMDSRLMDYEDELKALWGLKKESDRAEFFTLYDEMPEIIKFIFCASARVG